MVCSPDPDRVLIVIFLDVMYLGWTCGVPVWKVNVAAFLVFWAYVAAMALHLHALRHG